MSSVSPASVGSIIDSKSASVDKKKTAFLSIEFETTRDGRRFLFYSLLVREDLKQRFAAKSAAMDADHSGEKVVIKTRKPYTITKQRERWTEEEHSRFIEALKLYGRAWQHIEEHIGTKTAVQIRSHAQKFFSKLEKEALVKGISIGEALDIEIPPPRPKRKPSNPYPRKTNVGILSSQIQANDGKIRSASTLSCKSSLDLVQEPEPEKTNGEQQSPPAKQNKDDSHTKVHVIPLEAPYSSISSANKVSSEMAKSERNLRASREFEPSVKEVVNFKEISESLATMEHKQLGKVDAKQAEHCSSTSSASKLTSVDALQVELSPHEKTDDLNCPLTTYELQCAQNYPRHVPVQVLDGSLGAFTQVRSHVHPIIGVNGEPGLFADSPPSNASEIQNNRARFTVNQSFPLYPPLAPVPTIGDNYVSSSFSNLILSTLLQNPAAQAAASFAATFWPYANMETSGTTQARSPGFTSKQIGSTPSLEAIAAATVAAATAWWAAHGLLPLCAPLHTAFMSAPASAAGMTSVYASQAVANKTVEDTALENPPLRELLVPEHSEATQGPNSASKLLAVSLSDSEDSGGAKRNAVPEVIDCEKDTAVAVHTDSNKANGLKQVDRSSCGSNTTSCSELETNVMETDKKANEEQKPAEAIQSTSDTSNRRGRTSSNSTDSWKEVSEEGRLAFQALFKREVLPQSFSPPQDPKSKGHQKESIQENHQIMNTLEQVSTRDLNSKKRSPDPQEAGKSSSLTENGEEQGQLTIGLGQGKLKLRRTGFKPYKRCSVEAKENIVGHSGNQTEEKGPKGICLEGEAST